MEVLALCLYSKTIILSHKSETKAIKNAPLFASAA